MQIAHQWIPSSSLTRSRHVEVQAHQGKDNGDRLLRIGGALSGKGVDYMLVQEGWITQFERVGRELVIEILFRNHEYT